MDRAAQAAERSGEAWLLLASCFAAWYRQYRNSQDQDKALSRQLLRWRRHLGVTVHQDGTVTDER